MRVFRTRNHMPSEENKGMFSVRDGGKRRGSQTSGSKGRFTALLSHTCTIPKTYHRDDLLKSL